MEREKKWKELQKWKELPRQILQEERDLYKKYRAERKKDKEEREKEREKRFRVLQAGSRFNGLPIENSMRFPKDEGNVPSQAFDPIQDQRQHDRSLEPKDWVVIEGESFVDMGQAHLWAQG